ncbi:MAG: hypothetical protein AAFO74_07665 [Pseudomonadota bacterium]
MPRPFPDRYIDNLRRSSDGIVIFECSRDSSVWPWLKLDPIHPILVQTINFWASIDAGEFLGTLDPNTWTALTKVEWVCGPPGVGLPARGEYWGEQDKNRARYALTFFDDTGELVAKMAGEGVTFRTRNFEGWRGEAKEKVQPPEPPAFTYAPAAAVGVAAQSESFLAPLAGASSIKTAGLVTKATGLRPGHPYIGGSGDHVNSTHMGEIGRQFGQLLLGRPCLQTGGTMVFDHYVELDAPFEVALLDHDLAARTYRLRVRQADRDCTLIEMTYV